jgi:hypothetical protein
MFDQLISIAEPLYVELKRGQQEAFKKKVLFKINYAIALVMHNSNAATIVLVIEKHMKLIQ